MGECVSLSFKTVVLGLIAPSVMKVCNRRNKKAGEMQCVN